MFVRFCHLVSEFFIGCSFEALHSRTVFQVNFTEYLRWRRGVDLSWRFRWFSEFRRHAKSVWDCWRGRGKSSLPSINYVSHWVSPCLPTRLSVSWLPDQVDPWP